MHMDLVHDMQKVYRRTVEAMARPGLICNIKAQAEKLDIETGCFNTTMVLALMLLDTEVTFKVVSAREGAMTKLINQLTYAQGTELENADFIFVLADCQTLAAAEALRKAKPGNLLNPHQSATVIMEVAAVSNQPDLVLTGPGIERFSYVKVQATGDWIDIRAEKNAEYPLGIDLLLTDAGGNLLCLPRTTQITKQVVG